MENPYLTIQKAYNVAPKVSTVYIMNDISQSTTIDMNNEKKITLTSYSTSNIIHSIIKTSAINNHMIRQTKGTLILKNITLDGNEIEDTNGGIYVNNSCLNISDGTIIKQFISSNVGSGISLNGNAVLNFFDGIISNNEGDNGGAIRAEDNTVLTMSGGVIRNNTIRTGRLGGGGITLIGSAIFNFSGGIINNNEARAGGAIRAEDNAILTMSGGVIRNNTARGSGGAIEEYESATMTITGGEIYENVALGTRSGAINVDCATSPSMSCPTLTINGGIIRNNTAGSYSGGVGGDPNRIGNIIYNSGVICENTPSNEYETHTTCPS